MSGKLPPCPNPNLAYTDELAEDPVFIDLTTDSKAVYLLLLARAENGIIDFDLQELWSSEFTDWTLKLALMELAVAKLIAYIEGVMLYLPSYNNHVKEVENVES